jgi:hypothetical protein
MFLVINNRTKPVAIPIQIITQNDAGDVFAKSLINHMLYQVKMQDGLHYIVKKGKNGETPLRVFLTEKPPDNAIIKTKGKRQKKQKQVEYPDHIKVSRWHGCYTDGQHEGMVVPEAISEHSAKMAPKLLKRIIDHGEENGRWQRGDRLIDIFGGIGTTGIVGAYAGYDVTCVELEPDYHDMMLRSFAIHKRIWAEKGLTMPTAVNDNCFLWLLNHLVHNNKRAQGTVFSPPFSPPNSQPQNGHAYRHEKAVTEDQGQQTSGSLALLPHSGFAQALADTQAKKFVFSPPYADVIKSGDGAGTRLDSDGRRGSSQSNSYGDSDGQIGNFTPENYWAAMGTIYQMLYETCASGSWMAVVVKDYVRNKKRVNLCEQTRQLIEAAGFKVPEIHQAWLVEELRHNDLITGEERVRYKGRLTAGRRRSMKLGGDAILFEEVIWATKE